MLEQGEWSCPRFPPIACDPPHEYSLSNRKSSLVRQMKKPLESVNGYFIEGKFDKLSRPDSILASALNTFFGNLLDFDTESDGTMKWRIVSAIGSSCDNVLFDILPNMHKWLVNGDIATGSQFPSSNVKGRSSHRLKYMFCKLVSAIACRAHPLILYLDDIQCKCDRIKLFVFLPSLKSANIQLSVSYQGLMN